MDPAVNLPSNLPLTQRLLSRKALLDRPVAQQARSVDGMPLVAPSPAMGQPYDRSLDRPNAFMELLANGVASVNQAQHQADAGVHELLTGGSVTQAEVLTAVQKADMAFRLLLQIRNKLMAAYEELNSIRV